jgi:predicted ABC-type ATPase
VNVETIYEIAERMNTLITDSTAPTDKLLELLKAFDKADTDSDEAKLMKKRTLMCLSHTMQWRSKTNDPGTASEKTKKGIEGLFDLMKGPHDGLTPIEETVNRDGATFQETYWRRPGDDQSQPGGGGQKNDTDAQHAGQTGGAAKPEKAPRQEGSGRAKLTLPPDMPLESNALYQHMLSNGFVEAVPGLPQDSREIHQVAPGQYTPERSQLHAQIAADFLSRAKPVPAHQKPVALVMMGGPGSGKSSATKGMDLSDFVPVDPDGIKAELPEYQQAVQGRALNAARMVHEESSDVAKMIREAALAQRKNVLLDGVGADYDKMSHRIEDLKSKGYHVRLVSVHLPAQEGKRRAAERALNNGRWVPMEFAEQAYNTIPNNFARLQEQAHDAAAYDNNVQPGTPPLLMFNKQHGGQTNVHDPQRYASYMGAYYEPPGTPGTPGPREPATPR